MFESISWFLHGANYACVAINGNLLLVCLLQCIVSKFEKFFVFSLRVFLECFAILLLLYFLFLFSEYSFTVFFWQKQTT